MRSIGKRIGATAALSALLLSGICGVGIAAAAGPPEARIEGLQPEVGLSRACRVAQTYLNVVPSRQVDRIVDMFADKVDYLGPDGVMRHTSAEIAAAFQGALAKSTGQPLRLKLAALLPKGSDSCLLQFEIFDFATGDFTPLGVDDVKIDNMGKITMLRPYCTTSQLSYCQSRLAKTPGSGK